MPPMSSVRSRPFVAQSSFWSGAARSFDLFGFFGYHDYPVLEPQAAWRSDWEALANDWKVVLGDLVKTWEEVEPELRAERERLG